eukprot:gene8222-36179_t
MYFITHGTFRVLNEDGETIVVLKTGDFFGEIALLHNIRRTATIAAVDFCSVLVIDKDDFDEVTEHFPSSLESI